MNRAHRCTGRHAVGLLLMVVATAAQPARAGPDGSSTRDWHGTVTLGWYGAISGPLRYGPAAQLEVFPGSVLGRFGFGLYYRGDEGGQPGSVLVGAVYEAGASRPGLVMSLHLAAGYDAAHDLPVAGAGWRVQLGIKGPFAVAGNLTSQLYLDGVDTRLGIALGATAGLAW